MHRVPALRWLLSAVLAASLFVIPVAGPAAAAEQATVTVSGTVCHPDPATPVITSPADGAVVQTNIITVSGTATAGETIQLLRNNLDAGSTTVNGSGQWSLQITLTTGANTLVAKGCFTSTPVTVTYQPASPEPDPEPPAPQPQPQPPGSQPGQPPLVFPSPVSPGEAGPAPRRGTVRDLFLSVSGSSSRSVRVGEEARLRLAIHGGRGPYRLRVDWGDGRVEELTVGRDGKVTLTHRYDRAGQFRPVVTVTDADGRRGVMWFSIKVTEATPRPSASPAAQPDDDGPVWWELLPPGLALLLLLLLLLLMMYRRKRDNESQKS